MAHQLRSARLRGGGYRVHVPSLSVWGRPLAGHHTVRLAVPGVLSLALIILCVMTCRTGGTDDDWTMSIALSGRLPDEGLTLFINVFLSKAIFALSQVLPNVAWLYVFELVSSFAALWALGWACLSLVPLGPGVLLWAATAFMFLPGCTYAPNFTFVASLCSLAGFALLAGACRPGRRGENARSRVALSVCGVVLCCLGACWRLESFVLCLPFFAVAVVWPMLARCRGRRQVAVSGVDVEAPTSDGSDPVCDQSREASVGERRIRLLPLVVLAVCLGALLVADRVAWSAEPWASWTRYNDARAAVSDYPMPPYDEVADSLVGTGVTKSDYWLATHWVTGDTSLGIEQMEALAALHREAGPERLLQGPAKYAKVLSKEHPPYALMSAVAVLTCALVFARGRRARLVIAALMLIALVACWYFAALGRLPDRVERPIWAYACMAALLVVGWGAASERTGGNRFARGVALMAGCLGIAWIGAFVAFLRPTLEPSRTLAVIDQRTYEPMGSIVDYIEGHPDTTYAWTPGAFETVSYAYAMRFVPEEEFLARNITLGGWAVESPFYMARNEEARLAMPLRDLATNENARLVVRGEKEADGVMRAVRELYWPNAGSQVEARLQDSLTGIEIMVLRVTPDGGTDDFGPADGTAHHDAGEEGRDGSDGRSDDAARGR